MKRRPSRAIQALLTRRHRPLARLLGLGGALLLTPLLLAAPAGAVATSPALGSAATFAVLGGSAVTNTGASVVTGDLGVSPGSSISGFPPGHVIGTVQSAPVSTAAQASIGTAIGQASSEQCDQDLSGQNLGGMTLTPGVYCFASSAQLTGVLKLDALGSSTAAWLFKITSSLTTASNAAVVLVNGGSQCVNQVTWLIGSSATVGSGSIFLGNILANTSITLATGSNSTGSLYAHTGAVTLDDNKVSTCDGTTIPPPPPLNISTTPSGHAQTGGPMSDTATVSGGLSPSGTVTFALYGPGDPDCMAAPVASTTGTLNGGIAASGPVTAGPVGTYNWVATYGGDANNGTAFSPCHSETVVVAPPPTMTGRAYGLTATATLLGVPLVDVVPVPDTGPVATSASSSTSTPCLAALNQGVTAHVLCANVTTVALPGTSTASASVADAGLGLVGVTLRTVASTSTTTCTGSSGTTTIAFLKVGSTVVISQPTAIAPNTRITVGSVSLVLNEQIPVVGPDAGLTVNAVHLSVDTLGLARTNLIVASSESDIGNCP